MLLHRGDVVAHHETLTGDGKGHRWVSGWVEYGVVTSVRRVPGFPKIQDCRIDFYGAYRGNIGRTKPYKLRYYNSSLEKLDR